MNSICLTELRAAYNLPMLNQVCQTVKLCGVKALFSCGQVVSKRLGEAEVNNARLSAFF
jgi:hypothetical protein